MLQIFSAIVITAFATILAMSNFAQEQQKNAFPKICYNNILDLTSFLFEKALFRIGFLLELFNFR